MCVMRSPHTDDVIIPVAVEPKRPHAFIIHIIRHNELRRVAHVCVMSIVRNIDVVDGGDCGCMRDVRIM